MSDDNNPMHAGHRPPVRQRRPGEQLWTVRKDHVTWSCELKFHGESYSWEAQIFHETDFWMGRRFILKQEAAAWANWMRDEIEKGLDERFD